MAEIRQNNIATTKHSQIKDLTQYTSRDEMSKHLDLKQFPKYYFIQVLKAVLSC